VPPLVSNVRVSLIGVFKVYINDKPLQLKHDASRKVMLLLFLSEDLSWSRETLAGMIWPDSTRARSLAHLRQTLFNLKKILQPLCGENSLLQADLQSVSLVHCSVSLDTKKLINTIRQKQRIDSISLPVKHVADGYNAELKSGSDLFIAWLEASESTFFEQLKNSLQDAIDSLESPEIGLQFANLLAGIDPYNELACRTKMKVYHGNGEKAEAMKCYSDLWVKLEENFDVEPSSATQELAVAIKIDESPTKTLELRTQIVFKDGDGIEKHEALYNVNESPPPTHWNLSESTLPRVAVIPFVGRGVTEEGQIVGEVLADDLINVLSTCKTISVISRRSSSVLSGLTSQLEAIRLLQVQYLISGSYRIHDEQIVLDVEFSSADTASILWRKRFTGTFSEFVNIDHPIVEEVLQGMGVSVMANELRKSYFQPIEQLETYTLLISAIALMHRLTVNSFKQSKDLFETLIARNKKHALPYAYLSQWYALRINRGWSENPVADGEIADKYSKIALDLDPFLGLAHTQQGTVNTIFKKDLESGERDYTAALEYNHSESLAWLLRGTLYAFQGKGLEAVGDTMKAIALSPIDPHRYFYFSLAGSAALAAGNYDEAIRLTEKSLRLNSEHSSTLRVLAVAFIKCGREEESRKVAKRLLRLQPTLTVSSWLKETPCANYAIADEIASAMICAGIPK